MDQLQDVERYIHDGDVDALAILIDRLVQSTDFDLLYESAALLTTYGFMAEADRLYETLILHLPDEAQLKIDRATTLMELGDEDAALLLLSDIGSEDDEYVQALLVLADYYHMTGLAETALDKIKEAYKLVPGEPVIRFAYAELLLDSGKYGEAARLYLDLKEEVVEIGGVSIVSRLAETYSAGAAYEEALPYYEEMLKEKILPDTLFGAAFAYYQCRDTERALTHLDQLIEIDPDYFSAYMLAGQAWSLAGDDKKAYDMFKDGIRRDEYDKELQLSAGKMALKLGLPVEAEDHLKEALVLDPEYSEAIITLASLYNELENDQELNELLNYAKEELEDNSLIYAFKAYSNERMELFNEAYESYKKAYGGMKDDYEFLTRYANFLLEEGKHSEAIEIVKRVVTLFPDDQHWREFMEAQIDKGE
ncbi:tetratricopeptide repeat protein [Sporosarcina sp. CAU 1771]